VASFILVPVGSQRLVLYSLIHTYTLYSLYAYTLYMLICLYALYAYTLYMLIRYICLYTLYACTLYMLIRSICLYAVYIQINADCSVMRINRTNELKDLKISEPPVWAHGKAAPSPEDTSSGSKSRDSDNSTGDVITTAQTDQVEEENNNTDTSSEEGSQLVKREVTTKPGVLLSTYPLSTIGVSQYLLNKSQ